ncbi:MAG: UPF0158 family protein [candidate division WOR-3 bacterium]|nr:UPF0158 family protein [candidate division WOR-3 bacterium]
MKVSLDKILESMVFVMQGQDIYINKKTQVRIYDNMGEITKEGEPMTYDEMFDEIEGNDEWLCLPTRREIHDWDIMRQFCESIKNDKICDDCMDSIRGKGAFARFKRFTNYYNLREQWDDFQFKAYKKIAIKWCEEHDLEYIDDAEHL